MTPAQKQRKNFPKAAIALFVVLGLSACSFDAFAQKGRVCFSGQCVYPEIAQNSQERLKGLKFREHLEKDEGMLFIFEREGVHSFWMKDTLLPLDIIWMDGLRTVVHIERNVPPCQENPCPRYTSPHEARYVLEINAGYSDALGIHLGDKAEFDLEN